MKILGREDILGVKDLKIELVEVPEWGGSVYVRSLTALERDEFEGSIISQAGKQIKFSTKNIRAKLVAKSICNEEGKRLFADQDILLLGEKSAEPIDRIYSVAQRLSGISDSDVEELEKNSEIIHEGDSTSD